MGDNAMEYQQIAFETAKWITDKSLKWPKKKSPTPLVFRKQLYFSKSVRKATIIGTALGIYELDINREKVGEDWFAPGFTSYSHQIQIQQYDITAMLEKKSVITATVAGGWAVGEFNYKRTSRIAADRPALILELSIEYEDETNEIFGTDESWLVTSKGQVRAANWYDGEYFDARIDLEAVGWKNADITQPRANPKLLLQYGTPVRVWNILRPAYCFRTKSGEGIYDFGQNFAGVISIKAKGGAGQKLIFRHAELLKDGELYTEPLRTAKATVTYICRDGEQQYTPRFTYMGFRYVGVSGIEAKNIEIEGLALSSLLREVGGFECSDSRLNRLQENIHWSARSNFVDIPTDCPQRDERLGWTGDISIFASTACFNYDMSQFLNKWLLDLRSEQGLLGGIPMVVPKNGHEWPAFTTACWGDSCVLVPWAGYLSNGDITLLQDSYLTIKRFLKSVKHWAALFSLGKRRYIWKYLFQYGDWCAPQEPPEPWPKCVRTWMKRGPWIATAYYANSCNIAAMIADILGKDADARYYRNLRQKICEAYRTVFTDCNGRLKQEFQTGYVLPLMFQMMEGIEAENMAKNLDRIVEVEGNKLSTGFPSTPYLLFALSDHGYVDRAYQLLMQEDCPSWLYEISKGATTIWERWDAISPDGSLQKETICSCNHYAYGAVGDWLYRRVLGIEAVLGGYKEFYIAPTPGGGLTWAKGWHDTPYGRITVRWEIQENTFVLECNVPQGTECQLKMPSGTKYELYGGSHRYKENL
jgi:alpha-L-rhamnosidase